MGAWGHRNFDNDMAADYLAGLREGLSEADLVATLEAAVEDDYLDADAASEALAAAEIIAANQQKPAADFPPDALTSAAAIRIAEPELVKKLARKAVKAILKESELRELWEESDEYKDWRAVQRELLERLA
ncbi:DUF4259 domain-containing protein [Hymenobacter convexus]|uniref:DUF4259 domain-containing protein n=1 Tax=Hymenobacter sp. CA1UV-4 TaxID=3063782 RepID=UPI0027140141|nr:DUF4259 domain-containing protein [Hymenobacter sp. CA1UV-4]MDO7853272.1 DUF4259 domain-containing protein [Hymenobacter sp. CA1UV-4]